MRHVDSLVSFPRADRSPIPVVDRWDDRPLAFDVQFTRDADAFLSEHHLGFDMRTAEILAPSGKRIPAFGEARARYQARAGEEGPAWLMEMPRIGLFVAPKGHLVLDVKDGNLVPMPEKLGGGAQGLDFGPLSFFQERYIEEKTDWSEEALRPLAPEELERFQRREIGGVTLSGRDPVVLERIAEAFQEVCGKAAEGWRARAAARRMEAQTLRAALTPSRPESVRGAIEARLARLEDQSKPVVIVAVPEGKSVAAMPQILPEHRAMSANITAGVYHLAPEANYLFVPEETISSDRQFYLRHELYHLLDDIFLSDRAHAAIDAIFERTARGGGPFANPYGARRREFLSTMGELYEGQWGDGDRAWLEDQQPELAELLRAEIGR